MAFKYFENAVEYGGLVEPNDMYRDAQQAFQNEAWDNTSAKSPENGGAIYEQEDIGSAKYNCIEAWVNSTVADVTTGAKDSRDFLKLIFRCIDHQTKRGLYYKFDNNYWIVHSYNHFNGLTQDIGIRRCNNYLRIIDPQNGAVFSAPCVVDYDMMSPMVSTNRYIITPNGHITVITQANDDTLRLFTLNKRFIIDGRPFKLNAYQNSLEYDMTTQKTTILYLDLYLDEQHAEDDMINQVADNGEHNYELAINSDDMELTNGSTGKLTTTVTLNGTEVSKNVVWSSSNKSVVTITNNGTYSVVGTTGASAIITASLSGNDDIYDSITITVASIAEIEPVITLNPQFDKIRQYGEITFSVEAEYNGVSYANPTTTNVTISAADSQYVTLTKNGNTYTLKCGKISKNPINLHLTVNNTSPSFSATDDISIKTTSMLG